MAPNSNLPVVKTFEVPDAPTGESTRYVTDNGSVWKGIFTHSAPAIGTGDRVGILRRL